MVVGLALYELSGEVSKTDKETMRKCVSLVTMVSELVVENISGAVASNRQPEAFALVNGFLFCCFLVIIRTFNTYEEH